MLVLMAGGRRVKDTQICVKEPILGKALNGNRKTQDKSDRETGEVRDGV